MCRSAMDVCIFGALAPRHSSQLDSATGAPSILRFPKCVIFNFHFAYGPAPRSKIQPPHVSPNLMFIELPIFYNILS